MRIYTLMRMDGWMNGVLGHFYALSRLNWAGDNLGTLMRMNIHTCKHYENIYIDEDEYTYM